MGKELGQWLTRVATLAVLSTANIACADKPPPVIPTSEQTSNQSPEQRFKEQMRPIFNLDHQLQTRFPQQFLGQSLEGMTVNLPSGFLVFNRADPRLIHMVSSESLNSSTNRFNPPSAVVIIGQDFFQQLNATEQVILLREYLKRREIYVQQMNRFSNQPATAASILEAQNTTILALQEAYRISKFTGCQQIEALKSAASDQSSFQTKPALHYEGLLKELEGKSLYQIYLEIKDKPAPQQDPKWTAAINIIFTLELG